MRFRPCIDLHDGKVKQIIGGTLSESNRSRIVTNFISDRGPEYYADLYRKSGLAGGHVIMLGPGNESAAVRALAAYPGGLQVGGGINPDNAADWLCRGADKVIVTSCAFHAGRIHWDVLHELVARVGRDHLVLDLSCRRKDDAYYVVTDRWQTFTDVTLSQTTFQQMGEYCAEFLVHAVDVEGRNQGIDEELLQGLASWTCLPVTYAGGIRHMSDLLLVERLGHGRIDATAGSALDIFGGTGLTFEEIVAFDASRRN